MHPRKQTTSSIWKRALQLAAMSMAATLFALLLGLSSNQALAATYAHTQNNADSVVDGHIILNITEGTADAHDMEAGTYFLDEILREGDDHTATGYIFHLDVSWGRDAYIRVPANNLGSISYRRTFGSFDSKSVNVANVDLFEDLIAADELLNAEYAYFLDEGELLVAQRSDWFSDDMSDQYGFSGTSHSFFICDASDGDDTHIFYNGACSAGATGARLVVNDSSPGTASYQERASADDPWSRQGNVSVANASLYSSNIGDTSEIGQDRGDFISDGNEGDPNFDYSEGEVVDEYEAGEGEEAGPQCDAEGGVMGLMACSMLLHALSGMESIQTLLVEVLFETEPLIVGDTNDPLYQTWSAFRNIANVLLVVAFMFVIYSLAMSVNIDAYTVKRIVPRLLVAAVSIQASYFISAIFIDMTNILGIGLQSLTDMAMGDVRVTLGGPATGGGFLAIGLLAGAVVAGGILLVSSFGLIFLLFLLVMLGAFFIVALRDLFIIMAVVLSPFAFLANLLPNTERWFKFWWSNFARLLLMYPFIILMIQIGNLGSYLMLATQRGSGAEAFLAPFMALIMQMAAIVSIYFAFKVGGSVLSVATGGAQRLLKGGGGGKGGGGKGIRGKIAENARQRRSEFGSGRRGNAAAQALVAPGRTAARGTEGWRGVGKLGAKSRGQQALDNRQAMSESSKLMDEMGLSEDAALAFATNFNDTSKLDEAIANYRSEGRGDVAGELETLKSRDFVGNQAAASAALVHAGTQAFGSKDKYDAAAAKIKTSVADPALKQRALTDMAVNAKKKNRQDLWAAHGPMPGEEISKAKSIVNNMQTSDFKEINGRSLESKPISEALRTTAAAKTITQEDGTVRPNMARQSLASALSSSSGISGSLRQKYQETLGDDIYQQLVKEGDSMGFPGGGSGGGGQAQTAQSPQQAAPQPQNQTPNQAQPPPQQPPQPRVIQPGDNDFNVPPGSRPQ